MSATTMHFGPEWMRTKHQPLARTSQQPPSPPPTSATSTYSALLSSTSPPTHPEIRDEAHPFRYSKEELLRIYKEGGGKGGLGLEVERWEGVVREIGSDPIGVRELSEAEKKLFSGPLNSDLRRRQSTDYLSPLNTNSLGTERPRLNHSTSSSAGSPLRERFGSLKRRESSDPTSPVTPRKQSLSSLQAPLMSPREAGLPSPRTRVGYTSSFDGVLNTGESWSTRRRASETSVKLTGSGSNRDGAEAYMDEKVSGILEEKEDDDNGQRSQSSMLFDAITATNGESHTLANETGHSHGHDPNNITGGMAHLSLSSAPSGAAVSQPASVAPVGPPPGIQDLAAVEWSYKDPSGQVQGPFRADLMQKWFDDGYFTSDLPMKRTHLDTQWMTVEELVLRAGGDRIFLSPIVPIVPPGLNLRNDSPMQTFGTSDHNTFVDPYQPAPIRTLRSSTLDSYNSSNHSGSPTSSLGAGRFGESPDPIAYGGRAGTNTNPYFTPDPTGVGRGNAFTPAVDIASAFGARRGVFGDATLDIRTPSFGNVMPNRGPALDVYGYNTQHGSPTVPWNQPHLTPGFDQNEPVPFTSFASGSAIPSTSLNEIYPSGRNDGDGITGHYNGVGVMNQQPSNYAAFGSMDQGIAQQDQQYPHTQAHGLATHQYNPSGSPFTNQAGSPNDISLPAPSQVPWTATVDAQIRRPGPFESAHPTAANTVIIPAAVTAPSQPSPWGGTSQSPRPSPQIKESSPWLAASQGIVEETWIEQPDTNIEAAAAPVQSNFQEAISPSPVATTGTMEPEQISEVAAATHSSKPSEHSPTPSKTEKSKSKVTQALSQDTPRKATESPPTVESTTPSTPAQKAPWAKEDELKKASISLREIQEAEAKKAETRKAAERERERATRTTPAESKEDVQSFTASWGLPTSQAGARTASTPKEASPANPQPITPPVWTNTVKAPVARKTMKEIQEEEERRKKFAAKETVAAAAARRAYAESTSKVVSSTPAMGSAWTTVGANGRTSVPAVTPAPSRPVTVATPSTATATRPTATTTSRSAAVATSKPLAAIMKIEEQVASPSHDFLRWLNDTLKGLNSSVNVEEIMSMLLSFPLDPDTSTLELISDLIYANSTTLDGRRFASEFVSKRKADAVSRAKGAGVTGKVPAKPVSIADVVKAAPKAPQSDWGFKVVNKKKKGSRA